MALKRIHWAPFFHLKSWKQGFRLGTTYDKISSEDVRMPHRRSERYIGDIQLNNIFLQKVLVGLAVQHKTWGGWDSFHKKDPKVAALCLCLLVVCHTRNWQHVLLQRPVSL